MTGTRKWERPKSVPVPTVWARYRGKPMPNGRAPVFRIQDYTNEWKDQVIHTMITSFLGDEPLCKALETRKDQKCVEEYVKFTLEFLDLNMGLIAIVENLDELGDKNLPALAGCNITGIVTDDKETIKSSTEKNQKIFDLLNHLEQLKNCFEHYQVSEYMYALGLAVDPAFRGHGLGHEILKARFPLCRATGIKVTATVFTSIAAQKSAQKAGFETLAEIAYDDFKDENGEIVFKIDVPKSAKLMGIRIH